MGHWRTARLPGRAGFALLAAFAVLAAACSDSGDDSQAAPDGDVGRLPEDLQSILDTDPYSNARWGFYVEPAGEEGPVLARAGSQLFAMGSNTKLYSVGTYLDTFGPDHTVETPVHQVGEDLVLVGMGDPVLGSREADTGTLAYSIPPQADANGLPGAKPAPGEPLAGLDSLAEQVAAAGITQVTGNVVVDDRLFEPWDTAGGPISPIIVNDNLIAVQMGPAAVGEPGDLTVIPETAAFVVDNQTATVAAGDETSISLVPAETNTEGDLVGNTLVAVGQIAEDADPLLNVFEVPDPASYARTLFIEALERTGVTVAADPTATNTTDGLPAFDNYGDDPIASFTSPTSEAIATLIWKISFNYAANLTVCLLAVDAGSTDCTDGLKTIHERLDDLDISNNEVWILNGAGSDFSSTTPEAMATWLQWMRQEDWGTDLQEMLPILGVDGSLSLSQTDTPSTGKVQAKTGTWAGVDEATLTLITPGIGLAGLLQAEDGAEYVFAAYQGGGTFPGVIGEQIFRASGDMANAIAAIQQSL